MPIPSHQHQDFYIRLIKQKIQAPCVKMIWKAKMYFPESSLFIKKSFKEYVRTRCAV